MLIIANNITSRNPRVTAILRESQEDESSASQSECPGLKDIAESCLHAGADILEINLQQHLDKPEIMQRAVKTLGENAGHRLCLSSNKAAVIEAGLAICRRPPVINLLSPDKERLEEVLPLAAGSGADLILLISDPANPGDASQMLERAAFLVKTANEAGIPNERLILDPGILHITQVEGQKHMAEVLQVLRTLPDAFVSPVRTACWLSNGSAGAPSRLRSLIDNTLLAVLAGAGLSAVFLDVLKKENRRTLRLLKIFNNAEVYADDALLS